MSKPSADPSRLIRVVLADDHPIVREGLRWIVNAAPDMEVVGEAEDGLAAIRRASEMNPDVLVLDLSMPTMSGAEAALRLRECCPEVRLLALTLHEERSYITQMLRAGATGYALKRTASAELVKAIRSVASGTTYIDPAIAGTVAEAYVTAEQSGRRSGHLLSDREFAVLQRLARGFSNKEIAAALKLSVKTVETYKARGAEKLGLRSRVDIIRHATQNGWLAPDSSQ